LEGLRSSPRYNYQLKSPKTFDAIDVSTEGYEIDKVYG
jgi:hypothetical protein